MTASTQTEYGVRLVGGHIYPSISRNVAVREVERHLKESDGGFLSAKPSNTYVVSREVTAWERAA